ncbi:MAG TPA: SRPBCC family protein [Planktothrix sp.]|jgi:carbon monoxide dehydrogenase subunit G
MRTFSALANRTVAALSLALLASLPLDARPVDPSIEYQQRLAKGEVIVGMKNAGDDKLVSGTILINEPPDRVWPIMVNPFEFKGTISPRMKEVEVVVDKQDLSVLKVTLDMSFFYPNFTYVVESKYENGQRIEFHRVGGVLKDFKGSWDMSPIDGGKKTELTYSMYIDPGFCVPQWIMREGVKGELPRTLKGLRERVQAVYHASKQPVTHTLMAAATHHSIMTASTDHEM